MTGRLACVSKLCGGVCICVCVCLCVRPAGGFSLAGVRRMASVDRSLLNWLAALLTFLHATLTRDHSRHCLCSQFCDLLHFAGVDSTKKSGPDPAHDSRISFQVMSLYLMWITIPLLSLPAKRHAALLSDGLQCSHTPLLLPSCCATLAVCPSSG